MRTYAGDLAGFKSGLLPGGTELGGSLWIKKQKRFNGLKDIRQIVH